MSSHRRSRRVSHSHRPRHRHLRIEPLEDRRVLSTVIFQDGFEGAFPGQWQVGNNNANTVAKWGDNSAKAATGAWSAFCADNGSSSRTTYDNNLNTYMQRQNVSLVGYRTASLTFKYWMNTESNYDKVQVNVRSQSGTWSNVFTDSGNKAYWQTKTIDLNQYVGQSNLIISFDFVSDSSAVPSGQAGVWVDDVTLWASKVRLYSLEWYTTVKQGNQQTISYRIDNPHSHPVDVWLGASIKRTGTSAWLDDSANDRRVTVPAYATNYLVERPFNVSLGADPGAYDIRGSVWRDKIGNEMVHRLDSMDGTFRVIDRFEVNNTWQSAANLGTITSVRGEPFLDIHSNSEVDWYKFTINQGGDSNSKVEVLFTHANGDLDAELYSSPTGNPIRSGTSSSSNETLSLNDLCAGQYYLKVYGYNGATNTYTLRVTPPASDSTRPTASLNVGNITSPGGTNHTFTVTYADNRALCTSTLDNSDIRVTGPNGYNQPAMFVSVNDNANGTPRTATYRVNAPGGNWDAADNGQYTVSMQSSQVCDTSNNCMLSGSLGTFAVNIPVPDTMPPTTDLNVSNITNAGGTTHTFTVTYSDNVAVNVSTIDSADIRVTGPNTYNQLATFVSISNNTNGSPRTATYRINAPGGSWNTADNGQYTVSMQGTQVCDTSSNWVPPGSLGTFSVSLSVPDTNPPTTDLNVSNITNAGGTTHTFTVTYSDNVAVNVSTIDSSDVRVTGPNGYNQPATFVSVSNNTNGSPRTATYRINAPGGSWDATDNGQYTVSMQSNQVCDTSNNCVPPGSLGTFSVSIGTPDTPPTADLSVSNITNADGTTHTFTVTYSDNVAVNVSTIDSSDVRVTGPNGYNQLATFVSVSNNTNGTPRTATYRINAPGGNWDAADNGHYTVSMQSGQVCDTGGLCVPSGALGTFAVAIQSPPDPDPGAGFVTASVGRRGDLIISGDNLGNSIQIRPGNASGVWIVAGIGNTRVNQSLEPQTLAGVTRDVIIRMQDGNDYVSMELPADVSAHRRLVPRDLRVEMGTGNDRAVFDQVMVGRHLNVRNGAGGVNELLVTGCHVTGNVSLTGGTGSERAYFSETHLGRDLTAKMGSGADLLAFGEGTVGRDINARLGGGGGFQGWTDEFLDLDVEGDTFGLRSSQIGRNVNVRTDTRAGHAATVWIGSEEDVLTTIAQDVSLRGGSGSEYFYVSQATIGRDLKLDVGSGDDLFDLWELAILRNSQVKLNSGSNMGWINDVNVTNRFQLSGGSGMDDVHVGTRRPAGLSAASASFTMNKSNDRLVLLDSLFGTLDVKVSSGNNELFVEGNRVTQRTRLRGGRGYDGITSNAASKNQFADLSVTNFNYDLPDWEDI